MVKIAICGAGIAGLSTYLLLQKHLNDLSSQPSAHEITIYEAYDVGKPAPKASDENSSTNESTPSPQSIGGGIGISKNGLNVLSRMERTDDKPGSSSSSSSTGVNSGLIKEMTRRGHPIERWEISTARGWTIVDVNLVPKHLRDPSTQSNGKKSSTSVTKEKPYMYHSVMITRKACWEILRDRVIEQWPDAVVKKRVLEISIGDSTTPNVIRFEDGTEETVDLVIGADGLRSVVRKAMFEIDDSKLQAKDDDGDYGAKSQHSWAQAVLRWFGLSRAPINTAKSAKPDYITPHYEGLVGVGGLVPSSLLESTGHKPGTMSIVFGPNGFFGYGYLTSAPAIERSETEENAPKLNPALIPATIPPGPIAGWWSTFSSSTPYPYNDTGSTTPPSTNKPGIFNRPLAMRSLLARHARWKNPTISAITAYVETCNTTTLRVDASCMGRCDYRIVAPASAPPADAVPPPTAALDGSYPTWTTPELPFWTVRGRVALVGDAAHALQPSSGQGACQALEDAEALALLLRHHLDRCVAGADEVGALANALEQYEALRMPRVHAIYERSQRMSRMKMEMGVLMEWTMYLMIYVMSKHFDFVDLFSLPPYQDCWLIWIFLL
ncbi:hypothetical protein LTR84_012794 [Exophiala bonariae]|uniref:FAD-binding domain-containing protein n=1 Tax=Exophiala bonariae TaxID=1690606 RepID=A0AAV9NHM6_9EURO|nr:hypothetical protein LTR84_012794 [Exophiala bonariae]